jgi:RNA polymerase sigma-70 factor (ECF subfamily)
MDSADQFSALVSDYYDPLFRFALSLTRSEADARDLTQHTFLVWARKGHELRDRSKVKGWLFTTLHRAFLQARRRELRFPHQELEETAEELPTSAPDVESLDSAHVLGALAKVDEVFQGAVALFYLEDCSYKDIASILEIPLGTVRSRIARGIAQLRKILLSDESPFSAELPPRDGGSGNLNRMRISSEKQGWTAECTILTGQRTGCRGPGFGSLNLNPGAQGLN